MGEYIITGNRAYDGIQFMCQKIKAKISDSFLADIAINVYSMEETALTMLNSIMIGSETPQAIQGGLRFYVLLKLTVTNEDCHFENLRSISQILDLLLQSYNQNEDDIHFPNAAIYVQALSHLNEGSNVNIQNTLFQENTGAISLECTLCSQELIDSQNLVVIKNCTFIKNFHPSKGGSLNLKFLSAYITDTTFSKNNAGLKLEQFTQEALTIFTGMKIYFTALKNC